MNLVVFITTESRICRKNYPVHETILREVQNNVLNLFNHLRFDPFWYLLNIMTDLGPKYHSLPSIWFGEWMSFRASTIKKRSHVIVLSSKYKLEKMILFVFIFYLFPTWEQDHQRKLLQFAFIKQQFKARFKK